MTRNSDPEIRNQDSYGNTALHMAVLYKKLEIIDWMLSKVGSKMLLSILNDDGFTPLTLAARSGKPQTQRPRQTRQCADILNPKPQTLNPKPGNVATF